MHENTPGRPEDSRGGLRWVDLPGATYAEQVAAYVALVRPDPQHQ